MCTVSIKVDDAVVRRINPGLESRESINKWLQGQVNAMLEEMASEGSATDMSVEELYSTIEQDVREIYAK